MPLPPLARLKAKSTVRDPRVTHRAILCRPAGVQEDGSGGSGKPPTLTWARDLCRLGLTIRTGTLEVRRRLAASCGLVRRFATPPCPRLNEDGHDERIPASQSQGARNKAWTHVGCEIDVAVTLRRNTGLSEQGQALHLHAYALRAPTARGPRGRKSPTSSSSSLSSLTTLTAIT